MALLDLGLLRSYAGSGSMLDMPTSIIVTVLSFVFSAGLTYGIMTIKQKASEMRISEIVNDLKDAVKELKTLTTEFQVMKSASSRTEKDMEDHGHRLSELESLVAKLPIRNRKR